MTCATQVQDIFEADDDHDAFEDPKEFYKEFCVVNGTDAEVTAVQGLVVGCFVVTVVTFVMTALQVWQYVTMQVSVIWHTFYESSQRCWMLYFITLVTFVAVCCL